MDRCLQQSKGRESEFSCCKIFEFINAATNENEYIIYTESGPVRATGAWSCAHRREIYYYERISTERGPVWATGVWSCGHRHETPAGSDFIGKDPFCERT